MNATPKQLVSPTTIWGLLCLATVITTWVLGKGALDADAATILTFAIVGWKIRLVFRRFMELDQVSLPRRIIFEAWAVAIPVGIGITLAVAGWPNS